MQRTLLIILAITNMAGICLAEDLKLARASMSSFYSNVAQGKYQSAAKLYSAESLTTEDIAKLLNEYCSDSVHSICLPVKRIVEEKIISPNEFQFIIQFKNSDGSIYQSGDRGWNPKKGEYRITDFNVRVEKCGKEFKVTGIPGIRDRAQQGGPADAGTSGPRR